MSSRQLWSKGESDRLSLPAATEKAKANNQTNKRWNNNRTSCSREQLYKYRCYKINLQDLLLLSPLWENSHPTTGHADSSSSPPPQDATVMPLPPVNTVPPARPGTLQVFFHNNNTQDSGLHMSPMSGPLFTEDTQHQQ